MSVAPVKRHHQGGTLAYYLYHGYRIVPMLGGRFGIYDRMGVKFYESNDTVELCVNVIDAWLPIVGVPV